MTTNEGRESGFRANGPRTVDVRRVPEILSVKEKLAFLHEIGSGMNRSRPRLVLDCSAVRECDTAIIHLLLHCLEEAMKRNGDVKLAAVPAPVAEVMADCGVSQLFETFGTTEEAVSSFYRLPPMAAPALGERAPKTSGEAA